MPPIADLSYRNYDGPIDPPERRWWVIAKQGMYLASKKKSLYVATVFSAWYYLMMIIILFFVEQFTAGNPAGKQAMSAFVKRLIWKDQFLIGFSYSQLILMLVALLIGAGSIANDNRTNALLVYLSKPCTKTDYLVGKWMGIFLPILAIMAIPTLAFYGYGALTFRNEGFLSADPWLLPKMMVVLPISAMVHASLVLGVSSLFNQGRLAGATYAGIYFLSNFFTQLMIVTYMVSKGQAPAIVRNLYYVSVDGIQIGLAKAVLNTSGSPPFGAPSKVSPIGAPALWVVLPICLAIIGGSLALAWQRVRAVEVVG